MPKFYLLFIALMLIGCTKEPDPMPTTPLVVKTAADEVRFNVEVAATPDQLQIGLMNRTTLAFNSGMIFNIYPVRPTAMWMKSTKIPLDMLFVAPDGSIIMIKEDTVPMSQELIISRDPVRAVVELNAGQVKRHGIRVGDKVNHALLNNMLDTTPSAENEQPQAAAPIAPTTTPAKPAPQSLELDVNSLPDIDSLEAPKAAAESAPKADVKTKPQAPTAPVKLPQPAPAAPKVPLPAPSL